MANVKKYTDQIAKAQKGRDVRDAIVDAINAVSDENNEYNQVKTDILEAQTDITEKVAKNEHTEQKFVADVKKAETLKQGLDSNIEQGTALKSQLDTAVSTANTAKKNLDSTNTTAAQRKTDLDGSISTAQTLKGNLESDISQGTTLKQGLDSDITQGTALKSQLETTISTADTGKKNLDASNTTAGKTKTALDASNTTAAETKADLDASNATASETKTGLDATNKTAAGLVTSLGDKIAEGTQVKTDIQTTGETAMSNLQAEAAKQQEYIKTSIDDTLSVSGKAADAAVTGKKIDSLKEDVANLKNGKLVYPLDWIDGEYVVTETGEFEKYNGWERTGYIPIFQDAKVLYVDSQNVDSASNKYNAFYDENKKVIEYFRIINGNKVSIPSNSRYFAISHNKTSTVSIYSIVSMSESETDIKELASKINAVINDCNTLKEDISTKITKFYASSQGENHLADSDNGKIQDMMLYGKSEQKRYSGKNLLNATLQTTTQNGVTCTANGDGTYTINGTATSDALFHIGYFIFEKDTKYKIVGCPQGGSLNTLYRLDGSLNANSDTGNGIVYSGDGNKRNARIVVFNGATVNNLLFKPMITTDLTATYDDFEPYTGGIPSPNPDYPQEIKSVVNPTVKVCGKNLLNLNSYKENVKNGITITPIFNNEELQYLILNGTFKTAEWAVIWIGTLNPGTYTFSAQNSNVKVLRNWNEQNNTFTVTDENSVYRIVTNSSNMGESVKNVKIYPQLELGSTPTPYEPYHEQTVTLPYTLNAIPVNSGGNVTIDGQQYIADYVDVERGKLVRMVYVLDASANADIFRNYWEGETDGKQYLIRTDFASPPFPIEENAQTWCNKYNLLSNNFEYTRFDGCLGKKSCVYIGNPRSIQIYLSLYNQKLSTIKEQREWLKNNQTYIYVPLNTPEEADLTTEEIAAFKALATYYPITNISINSEQLDGYAVFNYPISMENGWNYVKQQIGDTREYIYDMDARAQDTDLQAAEAYVNSEYAVALTELEV